MYIINSKPGCEYCHKAKAVLAGKQLSFQVVMHRTKEEQSVFKEMGFTKFPQIYQGDQHIGGYDDLCKLLNV